jgi:sodium-dependent dicarboxylate transporter 2/3/5
MSSAEKKVAVIIVFYALGFIFRNWWSELLGVTGFVKDSTVAVLAAIILFALPSGEKNMKGKQVRLLEWEDAKTIPWGIGMLIGGGLAIASSFKSSGLIEWVGTAIDLGGISIFFILIFVVTFMIFLTEVNSNTATTAIFLPVLAGISIAGDFHPYLLMIPATFAASCAFMLPSGTGPNASVLASGHLKIPQMARVGFGLNILAILLIVILFYFFPLDLY